MVREWLKDQCIYWRMICSLWKLCTFSVFVDLYYYAGSPWGENYPNALCSEMSGSPVKRTKPTYGRQSCCSLGIGPFQPTQLRGHMYPEKSQVRLRILHQRVHLAPLCHLAHCKSFLSLSPLGFWNIWLCILAFFFNCLDLVSCFQLFSLVLITVLLGTHSGNFFSPWKPQERKRNTLLAEPQRAAFPSSIQERRSNLFNTNNQKKY